jgi:uncharacterized membrane protein (UPF0127 family)
MRSVCSLFLFMCLLGGQMTLGEAAGGKDGIGQPGARHRPQTTAIFDHMGVINIRLMDDEGQVSAMGVKLAVSTNEHQAGFQYISPEAIAKSLILFVFAEELITRFHMRNVEAPLDIAFIGSDGRILDIQEMQPDPGGSGSELRTYGPNQPFRYVLEAPAGFFKDHRISAGKGWLLMR